MPNNNKFTEGLEKVGDRYRLREKVVVSNKDRVETPEPIREKIKEQFGNDLPIFSSYLIKLWAENSFNKNGRNYRKVFRKVLDEQKVTIGFVDHPEDGEESYKDVVLVGKNPILKYDDETNENWLCVEITFVGKPYGENCEAILKAGGFVEFSSSALGDVDDEGYVLLDGFFLERYSDVVVNSSNGQLFFSQGEEPRDLSPKADTILYDDNSNKVKEEKVTILSKDDNKNNPLKEKASMSDKISEKALELNIKSMIRDADSKESFVEKKELLESALSYADELTESTLSDDIKKKIEEATKSIHALAEKGKSVESLTESIKSLTEAKEALVEETENLKKEKVELEENYNSIVALFESKQYSASQKELLTNKKLNIALTSIKEKAKLKEKEISRLKEKVQYFEAMANSKVDANKVVALNETIKELLLENEKLNSKVAVLNESIVKNRRAMIQSRRESFSNDRKERGIPSVRESTPTNESTFNNKEVEIYYNALLEDDSSLKLYKDKFSRFASLKEAQRFRMNMGDSSDRASEDSNKEEVNLTEKILADKGYI